MELTINSAINPLPSSAPLNAVIKPKMMENDIMTPP
jgi:hypothetical protein